MIENMNTNFWYRSGTLMKLYLFTPICMEYLWSYHESQTSELKFGTRVS